MKPMRLAAAAAGLLLSLTVVSSGAGGQKSKRITGATVVALQSWVHAVNTHTPGRADAAVVAVAALWYEAREELNAGMGLFLQGALGRTYDTDKNKAAETIASMGHAAGKPFLKQAAVLHSDVAAYSDLFPVHSTGVAEAPRPATETLHTGAGLVTPRTVQRGDPIPPLLMADRLLLNQDGQVLGRVGARRGTGRSRGACSIWSALDVPLSSLLARSVREPATDPFVSAWYHATTAYMFASGLYGDATPHLLHAADLLPDDAWILFDRACYAEILGLPMHQALLSGRDIAGERGGRHYGDAPLTWTTPASAPALRIPSAEKTNAEAERLVPARARARSFACRSARATGASVGPAQSA